MLCDAAEESKRFCIMPCAFLDSSAAVISSTGAELSEERGEEELADDGELYETEEELEEEDADEEYLDDASASDELDVEAFGGSRVLGTRRQPARRAAAELPSLRLRPRRGSRRDRNFALHAAHEQGADRERAVRTRLRGARLLAQAAPGLRVGSGSGHGGRPASSYAWLQASKHTPGMYVPQVRV